MSEAPERIWLTSFVKDQYGARLGRGTISDLDHGSNPDCPEYTRAHRITALLAERDALVVARDTMGRLWEKEKTQADAVKAEVAVMKEALGWYAKQVGDCRKITPEGDAARKALHDDCGEKAKAALATTTDPLTKTWNEAIEAAASMFTSNDSKLIRHRIRKLKKGE